MRKRFVTVFLLLSACMFLFSQESSNYKQESSNYKVVFDTRPFNPFYARFGFRINENTPVDESGEISFGNFVVDGETEKASLQLDAFWSVSSEDPLKIYLKITPLSDGNGKSLDWTLNCGTAGTIDSKNDNSLIRIYNHTGGDYAYKENQVALRGEFLIPDYGSDDFAKMVLARYTASITMKIISDGGGGQ